jgi:hypothetical protein
MGGMVDCMLGNLNICDACHDIVPATVHNQCSSLGFLGSAGMMIAASLLWLIALQLDSASRKQVVWEALVPPLAVLMGAQPDIVTRWVSSP